MTWKTLFGGVALTLSLVAVPAFADGRGPHKDVPAARPRGVPELGAGYRKKRRSPE